MGWHMRRMETNERVSGDVISRHVGERHTRKGGGTNRAKYANTELYHILCILCVTIPFPPTSKWAHCKFKSIPGQRGLHASFWMPCPSQMAPPLSGAGLVQLRVRFW